MADVATAPARVIRPAVRSGSVLLVAIAAAMWASDSYFRGQLVNHLSSLQIVFGEDVIASVILIGVTIRNWRAIRELHRSELGALAGIAILAQALGTVLFTLSFAQGLFQETVVLQQTQPFIAAALAIAFLGERPNRYYWPLLLLAALAVYLVVVGTDPLVPFKAISNGRLVAGIEAIAAAICWASGTVLGRFITSRLKPTTVAALRFQLAIPVLLVLLFVIPKNGGLSGFRGTDFLPLLFIGIVPGVIALSVYYRGLKATPATLATIAELTYPVTASLIATLPHPIGFGQPLYPVQILGTILLLVVVSGLNLIQRRPVVRPVS